MKFICSVCGDPFHRQPSDVKPGATCSVDCSSKKRTKKINLLCANKACRAPFTRPPYRIHETPENACCSRRCATAHMRDRGMHRLPFRRVVPTPPPVVAAPEPIPHCVDYEDRPIGA